MKKWNQDILRAPDGDPPAGPPPATPPPATPPPAATSIPENWKSFLPEDIRNDPTMVDVKDVEALAKRHIDGQRFIGKNRMSAPEKNWTPEQYGELWNKLGRPETNDKYDISSVAIPDGIEIDAERMKGFSKVAHEVGLTNTQFANVVDSYLKSEATVRSTEITSREEEVRVGEAKLREGWGENYDANVDIAKSALRKYGGDELFQFLADSGVGNDPRLIQTFHNIGKQLMEDSASGFGGGLAVQDATAAKAEIESLKTDEKFQQAINSAQHPGHEAAVLKWMDVHRKAHEGDPPPIT